MAATNDDVLVVGAVQCPLRDDQQDPLDACNAAIQLMKQASIQCQIDLFVLPELAPLGYSEDTFARYLPNTCKNLQIYQDIHDKMVTVAMELNAYICYGTIGVLDEKDGNDTSTKVTPRPPTTNNQGNQQETQAHQHKNNTNYTIRQVVVDPTGTTIASYDKMFLCDYGDCAETRFFVPGKLLVSFCIRHFTLGILICADMRNPMYARALTAQHKVDVILQPAAFSRDFSFRTWKSFIETRAVENSVYWVGVNYSGENHGESSFTQPWVDEHHEPIIMGCESGVLVEKVSRATLAHVRTTMPYYKQLLLCYGQDIE
jgi:predicted amidohydrolase